MDYAQVSLTPQARIGVKVSSLILFTHQKLHFLLNLEKFKFTLEYT